MDQILCPLPIVWVWVGIWKQYFGDPQSEIFYGCLKSSFLPPAHVTAISVLSEPSGFFELIFSQSKDNWGQLWVTIIWHSIQAHVFFLDEICYLPTRFTHIGDKTFLIISVTQLSLECPSTLRCLLKALLGYAKMSIGYCGQVSFEFLDAVNMQKWKIGCVFWVGLVG